MDLTPEERQRIYEEEKARLEVRGALKAQEGRKKRDRFGSGCLILVGVIVALGIIGSWIKNNRPPSPGLDKFGAYLTSQKFVKDRLKSPSTAKFCDFDEAVVSTTGEDNRTDPGRDSYTVRGWVDAQNSFGAVLRNRFICKLHKAGDTWYMDDISLIPQ